MRFSSCGGAALLAVCLGPALGCVIELERDDREDQRRYEQINLLADQPGLAAQVDPNLVNPWGLTARDGELWIANAGTSTATVFEDRRGRVPREPVDLPLGAPASGLVRNPGDGFELSAAGRRAPAELLFATLDGKLGGWSAEVDPRRGVIAVEAPGSEAVYTGLAIAEHAGRLRLYAADFAAGVVEVFDDGFAPAHDLAVGAFADPSLPEGYAPFGIHAIDGVIFVTYAERATVGDEDARGQGNGYVSLFLPDGTFVRRVLARGLLDAPWAVTLAPADFGAFGGALLIGNFGDGRITAIDKASFRVLGQVADVDGVPVEIEGLWSLLPGAQVASDHRDALYFTAGIGELRHGLFGRLEALADGHTP